MLPLAIMAYAGAHYLHGFPVGGNDVLLTAVLTVTGIVLGCLSGLATQMWRGDDGQVLVRVSAAAITAWVLGMGFRFAFAVYANTSAGDAAIGRFSAHHGITSGQAWTTALVLMAFGEVLARVAIMQYRRVQTYPPAFA